MYYKSYTFKSRGRIYQSETDFSRNGSEKIRSMEESVYERVKMSGAQIFRIKYYISTGKRNPYITPTEKTLSHIVEVFHLEKKGKIYFGDPNEIYNTLRETYPNFDWVRFHNDDGKGFKRLSYAVTYGDAPCTIVQPAKV